MVDVFNGSPPNINYDSTHLENISSPRVYFHSVPYVKESNLSNRTTLNIISPPLSTRITFFIEVATPVLGSLFLSMRRSEPWIGAGGALITIISLLRHFSPVTVTNVTPDSPCGIAGINAGDKIIAVDGRRVWSMSVQQMRSLLDEGPPGLPVRIAVQKKTDSSTTGANINSFITSLSIRRPKVIELNVTRSYLPTVGVRGHLLSDGNTGYIHIQEFTDRTLFEVSDCLQQLQETARQQSKKGSIHALILDVRGNPGGTLVSALDVAALFLPNRKPVVHMRSKQQNATYYSKNKHPDLSTHLLLLTDSYTASASEILVAALRDHGRASVMGCTTVGKNVAQVPTVPTRNYLFN